SSAVNLPLGTVPGNVAECRGSQSWDSRGVGVERNGLSQRMLRFALHRGGKRQHLSLG
ncbi:MAG: hypothetical protein K0R13_3513, partial [Propionibacteriaceae bacterium]|nr:hypothetical protein [Propionibacteriaceae bacterium]